MLVKTRHILLEYLGGYYAYEPRYYGLYGKNDPVVSDEALAKNQTVIKYPRPIAQSIKEILDGKNFSETKEFSLKKKTLEKNYVVWGYKSIKDLCRKRTNQIRKLYESISRYGVLHNELDPIGIFINENGHYVLCNGWHRFFIARMLNIISIPVSVFYVSPKWERKLNPLRKISNELWEGQLYTEFPHASLYDMRSYYTKERYYLIRNNTQYKDVLDVGCLYGAGGIYLYGFNYTGVDIDEGYIAIGKLLRDALYANYQLINDDIFNIKLKKHDIIVMYNVITHFLRDDETCNKLINFLQTQEFKEMFLQLHREDEYLYSKLKHKLSPQAIIELVKEESHKENHAYLGMDGGREIYKVW